jgi:serine/threonine protein kinase
MQEEYKYIVTELMADNLHTFIHQKAKSKSIKHRIVTFKQKVEILLQIVGGMIYLHSLTPPIIHRDLKPSNILLDKNNQNVKLCDFGSSKTIAQQKTMTGNVGTLTYMSPEVLRHKSYSEKCDVYSFGIIMYELFFEMDAYYNDKSPEYGNLFNLAFEIIQGRRPMIPDTIEYNYTEKEEDFFLIMKRCWHEDETMRPTFVDICEDLEKLI